MQLSLFSDDVPFDELEPLVKAFWRMRRTSREGSAPFGDPRGRQIMWLEPSDEFL